MKGLIKKAKKRSERVMADFKLRNRFKPHYDVVVIGAGMGGLSAGIHAALAGKMY